jgi:hypothetical protein
MKGSKELKIRTDLSGKTSCECNFPYEPFVIPTNRSAFTMNKDQETLVYHARTSMLLRLPLLMAIWQEDASLQREQCRDGKRPMAATVRR